MTTEDPKEDAVRRLVVVPLTRDGVRVMRDECAARGVPTSFWDDVLDDIASDEGLEAWQRALNGMQTHHAPARPDPSQAWFWTAEWRVREREVDQSIARGEGITHDTADDFLAYLERLDDEADTP